MENKQESPKEWVKPEVVDVEGGLDQVEAAGGSPVPDFSQPVTS